mmetsp:Transcript_9634/g.15537  ORF Transcript_9634/g.15537 Transcript_9634/m.15537 type:complete len:92 (+) Transcript_9634:1382-1657(+)
MKMLSTLRSVHKALSAKYSSISSICQDNSYTLRYLTKQKVKNVGSSASRLSSTKDVDDKEPKSSKGGPVDGKRSKQSSTSVENIKNRKRKS